MKYALIIGNDQYDDPKLAKLKTPAADSQALAKLLDDKTIGGFDAVLPLINQDESRVRRALSEFLTNKKPDDLVLLYFSGHGVLDDRGRLYLALRDTQVSLLKATSLPSSFVADELDSCRSKRQILILDCCHSGAFARGTKGEQKAVTEATFEGSGFGRVVLTASDSTQYALEGDQVLRQTEFSLFTHFLLDGLRTGQADINNDGQISLDEWYDYTYGRVISETPRQVPHKWSYNQQGDLVIARNPFVQKKVAELPYELVQALESSFVGIRESAVSELGTYLRHRDPDMVGLAVSALQRMQADDSRRISSLADKLLAEFDQKFSPKVEPRTEVSPEIKVGSIANVTQNIHTKDVIHQFVPVVSQAVSDHFPWLKWIGAAVAGLLLCAGYYYYFSNVGPSMDVAALWFGVVAAGIGLIQWFLFRDRLASWWVPVNIVTGLAIVGLQDSLYQHVGWSYENIWLLLIVWMVLNFVVGVVLARSGQSVNSASIEQPASASRTWFALLFPISLILGNLASLVYLMRGQDVARYLWVTYGILAIITGLLFWQKGTVRNFGWVALALFLVVDGLNTALLGFTLNQDLLYLYAFGCLFAWAAGAFFAFHRQTWRTPGLALLSGYLFAVGAANLTAYDVPPALFYLCALFGTSAAVMFLLQRFSPQTKNAEA